MFNMKLTCVILVLAMIYGEISCIYIPKENEEIISYDTIKVPIQKEHNINHLTEMTKAIRSSQQQQSAEEYLGGKSYDTTNDIVATNNDDYYAEADTASTLNKSNETSSIEKSRFKRQLSDLLIVPNTKWCGKGNLANGTYNHLGGASMADKCCRRHDNCSVFIPALSNRYDYFNYLPYTLSHCSCDRRFFTCLKLANDDDSRTIGKLFFNMVQTSCFVLKNEKVCRERAPDGTCLLEVVKQKAIVKRNKKF